LTVCVSALSANSRMYGHSCSFLGCVGAWVVRGVSVCVCGGGVACDGRSMDSSGVRATLGAARACRSHALAWHALLVRAPPQQALHARARHGTPPPLPPPLPPPPSKHTATPEVGAHGPALDAADVGAAHRAVHLCQRLLELAVAGRHLGVADEARQQVHAVHGWVARQRLGQLDDVLDLAACACVLAAWRGVAWRGVAWRGVAWRGVAWRGVAWRGVAWRGVTWRGVAWRGVAWCR
jgi:hypothetical protein